MATKITIMSAPATENKEQVWNRNTEFCVDVKTILHSDRIARTGKGYRGVLRRDAPSEDNGYDFDYIHFTFTETRPTGGCKRNPHVFEGKYVTVTLKDDGTLRPNFRPLKVGKGFSVGAYAIGVCRELYQALKGLVEE